MSDAQNPIRDDQFEAYLDGTLNSPERAAVEEKLGTEPRRRDQVELQARIDASMVRLFGVEAPAHEGVAAMLDSASRGSAKPLLKVRRLGWAASIAAAAAAIGWLVIVKPFSPMHTNSPFFAARPLTDLYRETVANGFEPGYQCEEAQRFADAFARRQNVPLKLLRLPVGMRMLGLAYIGGLSPETTAMLGQVDGQRVMVFVDRLDVDRADAAGNSDGKLRVFRQERDGLVFYEVTPLDHPRMIEFLAPLSVQGASELPEPKTAA